MPEGYFTLEEFVSADVLTDMFHVPVEDTNQEFAGLHLKEWLRGYAFYGKLARSNADEQPFECPRFTEKELIDGLINAGLSESRARRFILLTSLSKTSADLFDTPLIRTQPGALHFFAPAFHSPVLGIILLSRLASLNRRRDVRLNLQNWSEQLFESLSSNELVYQVVQQLSGACNLAELNRRVSAAVNRTVSEEEILLWLALGAAARKEERPLVRPVIHTFVRGLGGAVVAFPTGNTEPQLSLAADHVPPDLQLGNKPPRSLPVLTCTTCGQHYFEHHAQDFDCDNAQLQGGNLLASNHRWWEAKDIANGGRRLLLVDRLISDDDDNTTQARRTVAVFFCRACGALHDQSPPTCQGCGRSGPLVELFACELNRTNTGGRLQSCICCSAIGRTVGGRDREPACPVRAVTVSDVDVLARSMIHQAERKRLLVFADNRQDAAFQAGWMQDHARRFRLRALMWEKIKAGPIALGDLVFHLDQLLDNDESLSRALLPEVWRWIPKTAAGNEHQDKRQFYLRCQVLREFTMSPRQRIGLESWGRVRVEYHGLAQDDIFYQKWCPTLGLTKEQLSAGIAALLDYERRGAQLLWDSKGKIFSRFFGEGAWEIQRGFLPDIPGGPKGLVLRRDGSHDNTRIRQWSSNRDTVAIQAANRWGVPAADRITFLTELWQFLTKVARVLTPVDLKSQRGNNVPQCAGAHQIDGDRLLLMPAEGHVWRCQTCRRVHLHRTPNDACLRFRCQGEIAPLSEDDADSYDLRVLDGAFTMLRPREHSAQVPQADRTEAELMFKGKGERLNCLVCTPTLELGVDIGQLDSVLMRNIPPLASNYLQRAGRAGRRHRMAVNLAYARPASHDRAYFAEPLKLLNGIVTAPRFNLHNGLLVRKHVHASLLTALFRLLRNSDGSLSQAALENLETALSTTVPKQVRQWFFNEHAVLSQPIALDRFATILETHRQPLLAGIRAVFSSFWPGADADLVTEAQLNQYLTDTPRELESVMLRIWGRLQWHRKQLDELARIRNVKGSLSDEEQAFERRCNEFINRLKGESSRQRRQAEGFDETNTYAVLAAEGFLPGYGLDRGSVRATALANRSHGGIDFELPRPSSLAIREYVPGNMIYANGERYIPRTFHLLAEQGERFVVDINHEAVAPESGGGALNAASIPAVPICDVDAPHISRISDEEDFRFQMPVCVWGYELGRHDGGIAFRAGEFPAQLRRGTHLRLINVGPRDRVAQAELGYPTCLVSGQTRSPYASPTELQNFKDTQLERHGRPVEEHLAFFTDIVADTFRFPELANRVEAYSFGESLRMAAAAVLDMEIDDLQLLVIGHTADDKVDLIVYDPMPGGSGLLQQIAANWAMVLAEAERICQSCEGQCASSCIDCLQTFRNAFYHSHLDRHVALNVLAKCAGSFTEENPIPPNHPASAPSGPKELPVNEAEDLLLFYMRAACLPQPECQKQIQRPRPYLSTTPDFFYPDDQTTGICIYLDGLSAHIHGNPATKQRDQEIRSSLEADGYEVFSITYTKLFDQDAVRIFLTRVAKALVGRDAAATISKNTSWFEDARANSLRQSNGRLKLFRRTRLYDFTEIFDSGHR